MQQNLYLGAMTGTSLDGIDVALVAYDVAAQSPLAQQGTEHNPPKLLAHLELPYPDDLRRDVLAACQGQAATLAQLGVIDVRVADLYTQAALKLLANQSLTAQHITAYGVHGQTVFHQPSGAHPFTWQLGDCNRIAAHTGIPVVGDFRRRDVALGGQGAPLVPMFHDLVFRHPTQLRVILNLGGIANITVLAPHQPTLGYDTGPANMLMDAWIGSQKGSSFDADGVWAASGNPHQGLLLQMLNEPYFARLAPKSTGRELFNHAWLNKQLTSWQAAHPQDTIKPQDVQATLLQLTVQSIAQQVLPLAQSTDQAPALIVCGGGARNTALLQALAQALPQWQVATTQDHGIAPQALEAMAFAVFARQTWHGIPASLPHVTGASRACLLGNVFRP